MAVSKQPSITPDTASGDEEPSFRVETKWKRFHPLRVVRKIFRKHVKRNAVSDASKKSWSTSELQSVQDESSEKCDVTSPLKIGLSVSHDSIFSPENTTLVGNEPLELPQSSPLSVRHSSLKNMFKDELFIRIRARRDSEDDGIDLQSSSCSSPTTVDVLNQKFKVKMSKSQTTYSEGSLLSMCSSENDEDSTGHSSGHSSRMSLIDRRSSDFDIDLEVDNPVPLNHTAARHKISVRPKRTHGLPRRRVKQVAASKIVSLPSTPEVSEVLTNYAEVQATDVFISSSECNTSASSVSTVVTKSCSENDVTINSYKVASSEAINFTAEYHELSKQTDISLEAAKIAFSSNVNHGCLEHVAGDRIGNDSIQIERKTEPEQVQQTFSSNLPDVINFNNVKVEILMKESCEIYKYDEEFKKSSANPNLSLKSEDPNPDKAFPIRDNAAETSLVLDENKHSYEDFSYNKLDLIENCEESGSKFSDNVTSNDFQSKPNDELCINEAPSVVSELWTLSTDDTSGLVRKNPIPEKLDPDSEFVLKPLKRDRKISGDSSLSLKDTKVETTRNDSLVSSADVEKESTLTTKPPLAGDLDEKQVSLHSRDSFSDTLNNILVGETNESVIEDLKSSVFHRTKELEVENKTNSSEEQPDPMSTKQLNSSASYVEKGMSDGKVTVSVSSRSENSNLIFVSSKIESRTFLNSPVDDISKAANSDFTHKSTEKPLKVDKPQLPDTNSGAFGSSVNSQKRVSVEIVPFSQRMKERKYQPISFANKEESTEKKRNVTVSVERKLSECKVTRNKDLDKTSNRHSFSGTISENKKDDLVSSLKAGKREKVQYPVQIRIHASESTVEAKDKTTKEKQSDLSRLKHPKKEALSDIQNSSAQKRASQHPKEIARDSVPKWEIKIQPAACQSKLAEEKSPPKNSVQRSESFKSIQNIPSKELDSEASLKRNQDNFKGSKDSFVVSDDPEPELLRVFARRSIKQKHCDKDKEDEDDSLLKPEEQDSHVQSCNAEIADKKTDSVVSSNSTVIKISENSKPNIVKPELKKKSKSFCEKGKVPRSTSPLKEINLIHGDIARSVGDPKPPCETVSKSVTSKTESLTLENEKKVHPKISQTDYIEDNTLKQGTKELLHQSNSMQTPSSASVNGNFNAGIVKDNQDSLTKEGHTPAWLQLAQQRRELREQRERLLLGGSPNSFMDGSNKPSRSSKVWDMVNNFQKLQMT